MKPQTPLSPGRPITMHEHYPPAAHKGKPAASNDSCEDGCFFCTGPETD